MIISAFAFEIGAIFLLVAMLMYGTMSGFVPRLFQDGKLVVIILCVALLGFAAYKFLPDLYRRAFPEPGGALISQPPPQPVPAPLHRQSRKQPETGWKTTVLDDSIPQGSNPEPEPAAPLEPAREVKADPQPDESPKNGNRVKRAAKSVGRFLHIHPEK